MNPTTRTHRQQLLAGGFWLAVLWICRLAAAFHTSTVYGNQASGIHPDDGQSIAFDLPTERADEAESADDAVCHREEDSEQTLPAQLHPDAAAVMVCQLSTSAHTGARLQTKSNPSHTPTVRTSAQRHTSSARFQLQQEQFHNLMARQIADGALTFRRGILRL